MTQTSRPWAGTTVGDAGPYTAPHWWNVWQAMSGGNGALGGVGNKGVFYNVPGLLAVTYVGPNFLSVAAGAAMIDGLYYENDAAISCTVTSATSGNVRDDRLVIRKYFNTATQNARLVLLPGSEVASPGPGTPPSLTQDVTRTTYWDIPLARVSVADNGVMTLTDEREYVTPVPGMVLLSEYVVTAAGGDQYVTFDNIPQCFADLLLTYAAKTTEVLSYGGLQFVFNNDVEKHHYAHLVRYWTWETAGFDYKSVWDTVPYLELGGAIAGNAAAGRMCKGDVRINDYSSLTAHIAHGQSMLTNGEHALYDGIYDARYADVIPYAGITKIRISVGTPASYNIAQGSIFRLYAAG